MQLGQAQRTLAAPHQQAGGITAENFRGIDVAIEFSTPATVVEGQNAVFTVTLGTVSAKDVVVHWVTEAVPGVTPSLPSLRDPDRLARPTEQVFRAEDDVVEAQVGVCAVLRMLEGHARVAHELDARLRSWRQPKPNYTCGVLAKYAALVSSASEGAVTDANL